MGRINIFSVASILYGFGLNNFSINPDSPKQLSGLSWNLLHYYTYKYIYN